MAKTRPSGTPIVSGPEALVRQEIASVDERGRLNLLLRWQEAAGWKRPAGPWTLLVVLEDDGVIALLPWEPHGARVVERYSEWKDAADMEALRRLQDRYKRGEIPKKPDN